MRNLECIFEALFRALPYSLHKAALLTAPPLHYAGRTDNPEAFRKDLVAARCDGCDAQWTRGVGLSPSFDAIASLHDKKTEICRDDQVSSSGECCTRDHVLP